MFLMKEEDLDAVVEDRPASRTSMEQTKQKKEEHSPAPLLPEIGNLGSGTTTTGGDLGWDEGMFKR